MTPPCFSSDVTQGERDLEAIGTLGFRGEALAAISSVARVDLFTRTAHHTEGVQITIEGGQETGYGETGCPVGTTVVIRDLFFNVPARAKFLKKDATESSFVENLVTQIAVSRPDVAIKFIKDGRESFFHPRRRQDAVGHLRHRRKGSGGTDAQSVGQYG